MKKNSKIKKSKLKNITTPQRSTIVHNKNVFNLSRHSLATASLPPSCLSSFLVFCPQKPHFIMKKKITDFYSSSPPSIDMDILDRLIEADNRRSPRLTPPPSPPVPVPSSKSTSTPSSKSKSKITSYLPRPTVKQVPPPHTKKKPVGRPPKKKKVRSLSIKNSASNSSPFDLTLTPTGRVKQVGVGSGNWRGGGVRKAPQAQTQVQVPAQAQGSPSRGGIALRSTMMMGMMIVTMLKRTMVATTTTLKSLRRQSLRRHRRSESAAPGHPMRHPPMQTQT